MDKTEYYQLSLWDEEDRIMRGDFNGDNLALEAALKKQAGELTAQAQTMAKLGNCQIAYGSYTGDGTYGKDKPCTLAFDHKPLLVFVQREAETQNRDHKLRLLRGADWAVGMEDNYAWTNSVRWTEKSVNWYNDSASTQFNSSGSIYHYVAFLAADE